MKDTLIRWSKKEFPNNNKMLNLLLGEFKQYCEQDWSHETAEKARLVKEKIEELWEREEKYWYQRSCIN